MAHGAPDYSNVWKDEGVYRLDDLAELAVRLGSFVSYDRRGDVYWFDGFDNGIGHYTSIASGTNSKVFLENSVVEHSPYSVGFTVDTGVGNYAIMGMQLSTPITTLLSVQLSIRFPQNRSTTEIRITNNIPSVSYVFTVIFDEVNRKIQVTDSDNNDYDIATSVLGLITYDHFIHCKIVIDIVNNTYVRVVFDGIEYDASDYSAFQDVGVGYKNTQYQITHNTNQASVSTIYVDNIIISINDV